MDGENKRGKVMTEREEEKEEVEKKRNNSLKGHREASNHSLQRQMGTNPLQMKRPDTKITLSLFFLFVKAWVSIRLRVCYHFSVQRN